MKTLLDSWRTESPGPRTFSVSYYPYVGHFHNLLMYFAGEIRSVLALQHADKSGAVQLFRFANGDLAALTWARFHNDSPRMEQVTITHPTGKMVADNGRTLRFHRTPESRKHPVTELSFADADALLFDLTYSISGGRNTPLHMRGYVPELEEFVRCVRTGETPASGVDDAEASLLVRQAVNRSQQAGGTWVDVEK